MPRTSLLSAIVLLVACAPAAPEPVTVAAKPMPPAPPAPKPETPHATWLFANAVGEPLAELDLGDKGVLQVGPRGRRWRINKDGTTESSSVLLAQDLIDVRRDAGKFIFLGADGTTHISEDPLGAPKVTHAGPPEKARYAMGKSALLGVDDDGNILRSTDQGATWKKSASPASKLDTVVGLVANARGEALLLVHPQRAFLSIDDGATWSPIATPGIGSMHLRRDANGDLWLEGSYYVEKLAKLSGSPLRLEVATSFADLHKVDVKTDAKKPKTAPRKWLVGSRLVELSDEVDPTTKRKKISVGVATLNGQMGTPFVLAPSASPFTRVHTAGYENNVVVGVYDPELEPRGVKLYRTTDDGKTWDNVGLVEGTEGTAFKILAGPGWIGVGEMCGATPPCTPPQMKVGTKDWQPLGLPQGTRPTRVDYDSARDRLYIVASESGTPSIYAGKKEGPFKKLDVPYAKSAPTSASIDTNGNLRLVYRDPWRIVKSDASGKSATMYLPFSPDGVDLTGDRGYAWTHDQAWETADGGDHWTKVAAGSSGPVMCSAVGCTQGAAVRVGWDLPDPQKPLLPSTDQPAGATVKAPTAPPAPVEITCKTTGPSKSYKGVINMDSRSALGGDVRWIAPFGGAENFNALTVARGTAAPQLVNLLPTNKPKPNSDQRYWSTNTSTGYVAVRYTFSTKTSVDEEGVKKYNPVDVDLGWYVAATGKSFKKALPGVKPFRVGRSGPSALTEIVEGGLFFLPNRGDAPLYFLKEDGKIETIPRPTGGDEFGFTDAVKKGSTIILAQSRGPDIGLVASNDNGKTWTSTVWTLGEAAPLHMLDGKPSLLLSPNEYEKTSGGMITFASLTPDPPPPIRPKVKPAAVTDKGIPACSSTPGLRFGANYEASREAHFTIAADKETIEITTGTGWVRMMPDGSSCTEIVSGFQGNDEKENFIVFSAADPAHGWLLQTKGWAPKFEARPISCTL
jgi:hypothetical protein